MPSKMMFALAAAVTSVGAYRADRKAVTETVAKARGMVADSQANDALMESASSLVREVQGSLLTLGLSRFRGSQGNTSLEDMSPEEAERMMKDVKAAFAKIKYVAASNPMWTKLRATIKKMMLDNSQDARDWISWAAEKKYDLYTHKSCNFFGGAEFVKEASTGKMWPTDAYWCGNPGIDWSGSIYGGKPVNDYCGASVGDASSTKLCGKYTDKELVLGLMVTYKEDPRDVNVMMSDCLMDIVDGDIYYCHKCAGRCSGW